MTGGGGLRGGGEHPLTVTLRIRPMSEEEKLTGYVVSHKVDNNMVVLCDPGEDPDDILRANRSREKKYLFDYAFNNNSSQEEVYRHTTFSLIENVLGGYNATVFAYGATGAGKTYTMLGTDSNPGIMYRTLTDLFRAIEKDTDMTHKVTMSYLEIYNEMIRDLLNPDNGYLELREDSKGVQVPGLSEIHTNSTDEIMGLLTQGNINRTQEPTAANKTSSRSHAILQITVKQQNRLRDTKDTLRIGKLFLIDLAGSERASNTHNRGKRMVEGAHINRSLLALGNCINALSDKNGSKYVNYRDSKLTRLLKDSLGGNCKTVMIAHISPASLHFEESRNTLVYAERAKSIKNKVRKNVLDVSYHIAQYTSIISDLRSEITRLREKLDEQQFQKGGVANIQAVQSEVLETARKEARSELKNLKEQLLTSFKSQMDLRRSLMDINNTLMEINLESSRHQLLLNEWEAEKAKTLKRKESVSSDNKYKDSDSEIEKGELEDTKDSQDPDDVRIAREELKVLKNEKERTDKLKMNVEKELSKARARAAKLEETLPKKITSEEQQEILLLLCKVHELEIENTELQSRLFLKEHEIRQRDIEFARQLHGLSLRDEIIQQQRALLEETKVVCPKELAELYELYEEQQAEENNLNQEGALPSITSLPTYKSSSLTNVNKQFLENEYTLDRLNPQDGDQRGPSASGSVHASRREILRRSSANLLSKESTKDNGLTDSPSRHHLNAYYSSSRHNTASSVEPGSSESRTSLPRVSLGSVDHAEIQSNTRNIAALAARKKTQQLNLNTNPDKLSIADRELNKTFISLHSLNVDKLPDSDVYLSPSTLANHDHKYGSVTSVLQAAEDNISIATVDRRVAKKTPKVGIPRPGVPRKPVRKVGIREEKGARRRGRSMEPNQMTAEEYFRQLAKQPRRAEHRTTTNANPAVKKNKKRSKIPAATVIPSEHSKPAKVRFPFEHPNGPGEIRELTPVSTPSSTVYQLGPEKGKGLTVQRRTRVFNGGPVPSPAEGTPNLAEKPNRQKKATPSITSYRKGDISIAGFSLQH